MKSLLFTMLFLCSLMTATFSQSNSKDQEAIKKIVMSIEQGWNAKSGTQLASGFDDVHDYIVWNGLYFPNMTREDNARVHQGLFDGIYKTTSVRMVVDKINFVRDDLAMVNALGATYDETTPAPENPKVLITMLFEKKDNDWKIIAFHNSDIEISFEPGQQGNSPVPPQAMFKSWYQKS